MKRFFDTLIKAILGFFYYSFWGRIILVPRKNKRYCFLDISDTTYVDRYLLNLVQQLNVTSETNVVLPFTLRSLADFFEGRHWRPIKKQLAQHENLKFTFLKTKVPWKEVSLNYFNCPQSNRSEYQVPLGPHPMHFNLFSQPIDSKKRHGLFFAGARTKQYSYNFNHQFWGMPTRNETLLFLAHNGFNHIIYDRITLGEYSAKLQSNSFFLALPGMFMPLCHNVFEAIFSECIPILHTRYLQLLPSELHPSLLGFTWQSHEDLLVLLQKLEMEPTDTPGQIAAREIMRAFKKTYFNSTFILSKIEAAEKLTLCAGEHSVKFQLS